MGVTFLISSASSSCVGLLMANPGHAMYFGYFTAVSLVMNDLRGQAAVPHFQSKQDL